MLHRTSHVASTLLLRHGRRTLPLPTNLLNPANLHLLLPFSSSTSSATIAQTPPHFMVEYLVSHCGFSPSEASKASKYFLHLRSTQKPDSVLGFLRGLGFDGSNVKTLVAWCPRLLTADVDKTLEPKIAAIRVLGFSDAEVTALVSANPSVLRLSNILPKIELLRAHLPSKASLLKALRRDPTLLHCNPNKSIVPNSSLLREHGVPDSKISAAILNMPWLLTRRASSFRDLVNQTVRLGFPHGSGMFLYALHAISRMSKETFQAKLELMKSFGWSEAEFSSAFRKSPNFLTRSNEKLRAAMKFLVEDVGLDPAYIAEHPMLLLFSLEKRIKPRHKVHQIMKVEGLFGSKASLLSIAFLPEEKFLEHYVARHIEKVPALREYYETARLEKVPA